jgi:hypothetical protein
MDSLHQFKARLELLDSMLSRINGPAGQIRQLKRSVYVLRELLKREKNVPSPYGPATPIVSFSIQ